MLHVPVSWCPRQIARPPGQAQPWPPAAPAGGSTPKSIQKVPTVGLTRGMHRLHRCIDVPCNVSHKVSLQRFIAAS